jgi:hypothetical protein
MKHKTRQQRNLSFKQIVKRKNKKTKKQENKKTRKQRKLTVRQIVKHKNKKTRKQQRGGVGWLPWPNSAPREETHMEQFWRSVDDGILRREEQEARARVRERLAAEVEARERERETGADTPGFKAMSMAIARMAARAQGMMNSKAKNERFNVRMNPRTAAMDMDGQMFQAEPNFLVPFGVPVSTGVTVSAEAPFDLNVGLLPLDSKRVEDQMTSDNDMSPVIPNVVAEN